MILRDIQITVTDDTTHGECSDCEYQVMGADARLPAVQHARETGHRVDTVRMFRERIRAVEV
jgi:hypothetical protein